VGKAQTRQKRGNRALGIVNAKALFDHPAKINPPPAHDTIRFDIRAGFDDPGQVLQLICIQQARSARARQVAQAIRAIYIETHNP
jgi:hypothetical protein